MKHPWLAWYPGDYLSKTRHLSMSQHGAYLLLLWEYYINGPIPARVEQVLNICCAHNPANRSDVEFVLAEFFILADGKYNHARADDEIEKREDIRGKRVKAGQARQKASSTRSAHAEQVVTQSQPQPHISSEGYAIDDQVHEVASLHPKIHDPVHLSHEVALAIAEAIARDGRDLVFTGTKAMAEAVSRWPPGEKQFIPAAPRFFRESQYLKDPREWERSNGNGTQRQVGKTVQRDGEIIDSLTAAARNHVAKRNAVNSVEREDGAERRPQRRISSGVV